MKDFTNKVVVVTGAGSGMGRAYALEFGRLGAKLALNDYDKDALAQTVSMLKAGNEGVVAKDVVSSAFDVSDWAAMQEFADKVRLELGNAHVVINNAGITSFSHPVWSMPMNDMNRMMQINFFGVVNGTKAFLPHLFENREGALVNISSVFGLIGMPNASDYCAAKFAVRGYTESLMTELQGTPVTVHMVCPGGVRTNIAGDSELGQEFANKFLKTSPDDVARRVVKGIQNDEKVIVFGHRAAMTWALSKFLSTKMRVRMLFKMMTTHLLAGEEYKVLPSRRG